MKTLITVLLIVFVLWLLGPWIRRIVGGWLRRRAQKIMMDRMEDMVRSAAGMPPRDKSAGRSEKKRRQRESQWHEAPHQDYHHSDEESLIPKEYAVDVEYTEYKEYSKETKIGEHDGVITWEQQEQVSDVEWVEINEKKK